MQPLSSFGGTKRSLRRRRWRRLLAATLLLGGVVAFAAAAYQVGVSQGRTEAERRERDVLALREHNRALHERAARADQQAEAAIARAALARQEFQAKLPQGELLQLGELAAERLRAGVPAGRLAFLLREARPEQRCGGQLEVRRLPVQTPLTTTPVAVAEFAAGRILASAEGATARDAAGPEVPGFDPTEPVTVRFLRIDGEVATAVGRLPLAHALVLGTEEFRFSVRPADRPGEVQLTAQRCAWP